jgi:hypothetical protein
MGLNHRARWAAVGAAVAVTLGAGGIIRFASAAGGTASTFTPITPCRLLDTRSGAATGATPARTSPLGAGESLTVSARGDFGKCVALSATATGATLNVTIVDGTAGSYLTVWPADKAKPLASSLNWTAGQGATPNQVTTALDSSGQFSLFNNAGTVDVIVDVVGLYEPAGGPAPAGSKGDAGPVGPVGPVGPQGQIGSPGSNGKDGTNGKDGANGKDGTNGKDGANGKDGTNGINGAGVNVMTAAAPDSVHSSGKFNSLKLDASGFPVISHYDYSNNDLVLTHCNDVACTPTGDTTFTVDSAADVGQYSSMVLSAGNPVIAYYDATTFDLKLAHCNDSKCDPTGAESIQTVDATGDVGQYASLALDPSGNPVISYFDATTGNLKVAHCNDANCDPAVGGAESIKSVTSTAAVDGQFTSIGVSGGLPTVAYYDTTNSAVRVVRCSDLNCDPAVGAETFNTVASTIGVTQQGLSMVLDAAGNPVISYFDDLSYVSVAHCNDLACVPAGDQINELLDPSGGLIEPVYSSITLAGTIPVVSYWDGTSLLMVARCLDADCLGSAVSAADTASPNASTGGYTSIAIDSIGNPIVASYDSIYADLVVTRCIEPFCNPRSVRSIGG